MIVGNITSTANYCNVTCATDSDCRQCQQNCGEDFHNVAYMVYSTNDCYDTEELKQLVKQKQYFDKPNNIEVPSTILPIPAINEEVSVSETKCSESAEATLLDVAMMPYDFLSQHPRKKEYKNKRTGKAVKACIWGPGIVEITFTGIKYSKTGNRNMGEKTRTMSRDEFNRKHYLHDNGI